MNFLRAQVKRRNSGPGFEVEIENTSEIHALFSIRIQNIPIPKTPTQHQSAAERELRFAPIEKLAPLQKVLVAHRTWYQWPGEWEPDKGGHDLLICLTNQVSRPHSTPLEIIYSRGSQHYHESVPLEGKFKIGATSS